jgi:hypothetical protein
VATLGEVRMLVFGAIDHERTPIATRTTALRYTPPGAGVGLTCEQA